jgi:hypothetical protein
MLCFLFVPLASTLVNILTVYYVRILIAELCYPKQIALFFGDSLSDFPVYFLA